MEQIECGGVSLYYPKGEEEIVFNLRQKTPDILLFLEKQGLSVTLPLHVILDKDLDSPDALARMIPHREIRIPLRAPGVLEDGYTEEDPWLYFYFKGLCLQGIYSMRSGIPSLGHYIFGEAASPNVILPPWLTEGVCRILYSQYSGSALIDPFNRALLKTYIPEDISSASNHPGKWPGHYAYRIYGIPFVSWLNSHYGWEKIIGFLALHGSGIIPIEIDFKAKEIFGKTWSELWEDFSSESPLFGDTGPGLIVEGYWPEPFTYWNASGINPGRVSSRLRGRYGFIDSNGVLWVTEYLGGEKLHVSGYWKGMVLNPSSEHLWDPAPGGVALTCKGSKPHLVFFQIEDNPPVSRIVVSRTIPGPPAAIQMSGPVISEEGIVAVSANVDGNWDIWVYDTVWKRLTASPSVEMDPWWNGHNLVFSSDISGTFQIHRPDMSRITSSELGAVLPRNDSYLCLKKNGWSVKHYQDQAVQASFPDFQTRSPGVKTWDVEGRPYSPWPSLTPNFIAPDFYAGPSDVQAGLATWGRDVSGAYSVRAGFRYSSSLDYFSFQASTGVKDFGLSFTRYPVSYDPENSPETEESRAEAGISFSPSAAKFLSFSLNKLTFEPLEGPGETAEELWGQASFNMQFSSLSQGLTTEAYSGGRRSLFGAMRFVYGSDIVFVSRIQAGKTWGVTWPGHGTFRLGGDIGEGYFTRRPSRLFPLRGFVPNILEADQAVTAGIEIYCPLANLQMGHKTLPLFLHRLSLGTFLDAGICSEKMTGDQLIAGAGFELITSMEIAWGNFSAFKIGVAWPVAQPDSLDEKGPVLVLQIGRPL